MNGPHQGAGGEPLKSGRSWREIRRRRAEQDGPDFEVGVARERARTISGRSSLAFDRFSLEIDHAADDRPALKRLRRRLRGSRVLGDAERAELLEHARYVPGCKPPPLELTDDGKLRPLTYEEIRTDRWDSETEDGLEIITPGGADAGGP